MLAAAGRLFESKGFSATSIADIAKEAGYTTGALYSNFAFDLLASALSGAARRP